MCKENELGDLSLVAYIVTGDKSSLVESPVVVERSNEGNQPVGKVAKEQVSIWKRSASLKLPAYMVPSYFEILPSLPLTPNGKIDRKVLPEPSFDTAKEEETFNKPYSKSEKLIAGIWADLLKAKNISLTDDFFELGGYSLIAIDVMNRIEKETRKKLPLSSLFQYSTISKLASALDEPADMYKWKSLVPIKTSGNKNPLYIIHGLGLEVMIFKDVAKYMDEDQPVYGLKAKEKDVDGDSLDVIEEMASLYISEITRQNPNGPYALLGYSAGGIIAFEMARQLKAMNKEIKMLGIIDEEVEAQGVIPFLSKKTKKYTIEFIPRMFHILKTSIQHPGHELRFQLMCARIILSRIPARLGVDKNPEFQRTIDKLGFALKKYKPAPFNITVDLFVSLVQLHYFEDKKFLGWKPYALKGIKLHYVKGDHFGLLLPPNCKEFARVIQEALDVL